MKPVYKKVNLVISLIIISFFAMNFCFAAGLIKNETKDKIENLTDTSGMYGYEVGAGQEGLLNLVQTVINAFLSIIGVILLVYLLSAGYKWMTAHGEEEKVTQAKDTIKRAIVGVIIVVAAYAISIFVMARLEAGTLKGGGTTPPPPVLGPLD